MPAAPQSEKVRRWLASNANNAASILDPDLRTAPSLVFDLSVGSRFLGADPNASKTETLGEAIRRELKKHNATVGIGRYNEARLLYTSPLFGASENPSDERRTIHLGQDLFAAPGTPIHAPLDGVVHTVAINTAPLDYGPLVILRHTTGDGLEFFTLYGHLARDAFDSLQIGQRIARGQQFARIGDVHENGGWVPHLHFQIVLDLLDRGSDFPGVAYALQRAIWTSLSPDPNLLLGIPSERFPPQDPNSAGSSFCYGKSCSEKISAFRMSIR